MIFCSIYNNLVKISKKGDKLLNVSGTEQDSWLAQQLIQTMTSELSNEIGFTTGHHLLRHTNKNNTGRMVSQALEADTIIQFIRRDLRDIIIDTKIYRDIADIQGKYISNPNRYQVNSYLGAYKDKFNRDAMGIILHIVNEDMYNLYDYLDGSNQSVEEQRNINLYMLIKSENIQEMKNRYINIIKEVISKGEKHEQN